MRPNQQESIMDTNAPSKPAAKPAGSSGFRSETVTHVTHWTDRLFSFRTTRDPGFRFISGQFAMLGLEVDGKPLLRAYSMASAHHEEELEFFSIKVQDGQLTSRLQHLREGDQVLMGRKATGTLVQDSLTAGTTLYLLATGTGIAPFVSIIKDPETYDRFEHVVFVHGCRSVADLAYTNQVLATLRADEHMGELVAEKLLYLPTVTREAFATTGRISTLLRSGQLAEAVGLPPIDVARDRMMLCGSPAMLTEVTGLLIERGFAEGSHSSPGQFVVEKAFVEK
jgi:ferredoxin--NADP+ reductase